MPPNLTTYKPFITVALGILLTTAIISGVIYQLIAGLLATDELAILRVQLASLCLLITIVGTSIFGGVKHYLRKKPAILAPPNNTLEISETSSSHTASLTILVVDDNESNRLIMKDYLQADDITIVLANDGKQAIEQFKKHSLDAIFMDIEMGDTNGLETTQTIRSLETGTRLPIIAVSAHTDNDKKIDALCSGFDDYLYKPLEKKPLHKALHRWCKVDLSPAPNPCDLQPLLNTQQSLTNSENMIEKIDKVIDIQLSLEKSNHKKELARDMLQLLIQMLSDEKENILSYSQTKDWQQLYQINHKIYGGSAYCGVPALQEANQQLEKLLQRFLKDPESLSQDTIQEQVIFEHIDQLMEAINTLLLWDEEYDINVVFDLDD